MEKMVASRRAFVAGGAVAGAAAGCAALGMREGRADEAAFDLETEVLVLGGGAAGCFAARYAMEGGAKVTVVEASPRLGGTALLSGGFFHSWDITPDNVDQMLRSADPHRRKLFIDTWFEVRDWVLSESGASASPLDLDYPLYGAHLIGFAIGGADQSAGRQRFFEEFIEGADVMLDTCFVDLIANEDGAILGAVVENKDGSLLRIGAKATVIATGSWQANKGMIEGRLGRWGDCALIRATPYNKGAGVVSAVAHGARIGFGSGHFYGHLNPWPSLTPTTEEEFDACDLDAVSAIMGAVQKFSVEGIAVNMNGQRFCDEGPENYVGDNYLANDASQQTDGHIFVVIDSAEDHRAGLDVIRNAGGVVLTADTVEDLADQMAAYKVNPYNLKKTIAAYQQAAVDGTTAELEIPKSPMPTGYLTKLDTPPFFAVQAAPGISGFYGGIEVADDCSVLGAGENAIPGLYAAPMASGGYFYKEYGGGLALCATFGAVAGMSAAVYARAE